MSTARSRRARRHVGSSRRRTQDLRTVGCYADSAHDRVQHAGRGTGPRHRMRTGTISPPRLTPSRYRQHAHSHPGADHFLRRLRHGLGFRPHGSGRSPVTQARLAIALKSTPQAVMNRENGRQAIPPLRMKEPRPAGGGGLAGACPGQRGGVPAGGMRGGAARTVTSQRIPRLQPNDPRRRTPSRPAGHASWRISRARTASLAGEERSARASSPRPRRCPCPDGPCCRPLHRWPQCARAQQAVGTRSGEAVKP